MLAFLRIKLVLSIVILGLTASSAAAKGGDASKAQELYKQGKQAYQADQFEKALKLFQAAHATKPHPAFLFNIAQTHYRLGDCAQAIRHYRLYLEQSKDAQDASTLQAIAIATPVVEGRDANCLLGKTDALDSAESAESTGSAGSAGLPGSENQSDQTDELARSDTLPESPESTKSAELERSEQSPSRPSRSSRSAGEATANLVPESEGFGAWPAIVLGSGLSVAGGGVALIALHNEPFEGGAEQPNARSTRVPGIILAASGAALATLGILLFVLEPTEAEASDPNNAAVAFDVGTTGTGPAALIRGTF